MNGYQKCRTTITYTARNLPASRTDAPGTPESATESFTYDAAGRQDTRTDFLGNVWTSLYPDCCGRTDPLGHGTITHTDAAGNVTHAIHVSDLNSHTDFHDPIDAKTYRETTTVYDERGRPVASTTWLVARGVVDPASPPIAGDNGIPAADGLTSRSAYDDDLDDGTGLDTQFATHLTGLNLGVDADGAARLITNPAGERILSFSDGAGPGIRSSQLDLAGAALTSRTQTYDTIIAVTGLGNVLESASANALGETSKNRSDGAGRTIETEHPTGAVSTFQHDAGGNRLLVRDANNVGQDCTYDALGRDIQCADTQEILDGVDRQTTFNADGQVVVQTDANGATTTIVYGARGHCVSTTDRISATTTFTHDDAGPELSITDAENQTTVYTYDILGRRSTIQWPDHVAGTSPGDDDYGIQLTEYDSAGRAFRRTNQLGRTITHLYGFGNRIKSPSSQE